MYIKVGKLMSKKVALNLLEVIPIKDMIGLKSICVRTVPDRSTKKHNRWHRGMRGQQSGYGDEGTSRISIYLWSMTQKVLNESRYGQGDLYERFIEQFATTLYHEIGHHVDSSASSYKTSSALIRRTLAEMRRLEQKGINPSLKEYSKIGQEYYFLTNKIEKPARDYAKKMVSKALQMNLLDPPPLTEIRFFKMRRDAWIKALMQDYNYKKQGGEQYGWPVRLALFDHLRRCRLGSDARYNLRELFHAIHGHYANRNELRRFKRQVLERVTPLRYISKLGRKYPYFTKVQAEELTRLLKIIHRRVKFINS